MMHRIKKKAAMSLEMVVAAILVMVVLVVLIYIFRGNIMDTAKGFTGIQNQAKEQSNGTRCVGFLSDNGCYDSCPAKDSKYEYSPLPKPSGGWSDCKTTCCEKTSIS